MSNLDKFTKFMAGADDATHLVALDRYAREMEVELNNLQDWKREAMVSLAEWDDVWIAAGKPGELGGSKAKAVLEHLKGDDNKLTPLIRRLHQDPPFCEGVEIEKRLANLLWQATDNQVRCLLVDASVKTVELSNALPREALARLLSR